MKNLKEDIKFCRFKGVYLLYGEERYLVLHYEKEIQHRLFGADFSVNTDVFSGGKVPAQSIIDAALTVPFLEDFRLILVKGSGLFKAGRKADSDLMAGFLPNIPEHSVIVFTEDEVDKRSKVYKRVNEIGRAIEMKPPAEKDLATWVANMLKKRRRSISSPALQMLLRYTTHDMQSLVNEIDKLASQEEPFDDNAEITARDIENVCVPALSARVFDLTDAVGRMDTEKALNVFSEMLLRKEQPLVVLTMIARQFRLMAQCKALGEKNRSAPEIASALNLRSFIVTECLRQARQFSIDALINALDNCLETDLNIKNGMPGRLALETLILKFGMQAAR
ncbi:MAG: DNA polymerase III subunit delta [Clostridiales bacterium]|jgi:DNA polymerase-3 subunit delta|nr:DNA polymerase III subunit delta [Clostridiales bacterium]